MRRVWGARPGPSGPLPLGQGPALAPPGKQASVLPVPSLHPFHFLKAFGKGRIALLTCRRKFISIAAVFIIAKNSQSPNAPQQMIGSANRDGSVQCTWPGRKRRGAPDPTSGTSRSLPCTQEAGPRRLRASGSLYLTLWEEQSWGAGSRWWLPGGGPGLGVGEGADRRVHENFLGRWQCSVS